MDNIKHLLLVGCGTIPASRRVEAPSRHLHASSPRENGFFSDFEAIRAQARA